jgi:hypothetical protein
LWIAQKYLNVPASLNVTLNVLPPGTWPSNFLSFVGGVPLETVWVVPSLFDQVTVLPLVTSRLVVLNAKPEMSIAALDPPPAEIAGAAEEPQAPTRAATPTSAMAARMDRVMTPPKM